MADTTTFISKDDFSAYKILSAYITDAEMDPYILEAQIAFVKPILGTTLHTTLQTAVAASSTTSDQDNLIAKIKPFLVYKSFEKWLIYANIKATPMGMRVLKEDFSEAANTEGISKDTASSAKIYEQELRYWLKDNKDLFDWDSGEATKYSPVPRISAIKKTRVQRS